MASKFYTDEEFEQAKAYLRDRLRNEQSMSKDLAILLEAYAGYLLSALFREVPQEDLDELIADLVESILADVELLAVDEHDRRDAILLYMNGERNGDTLEGRVSKRCHTFMAEITAVYLAGKLLNLDKKSLLSSIKANMGDPWKNEVIIAAREKISRGDVAGNLEDFEEPHYGKGNPISSLTALDMITGYAIGDAWTWWGYEDARSKGAKGYFVVRGSSYPCDICDSHTGIFYKIDDEENKPLYHRNCCCIVVYSYVERL